MAITGAAEEIQVPISGDSSGLNDALEGGIGKLGDFRTAVGLAGAALATFATKQLADAVGAAEEWESVMADVEKVTDPETAGELSGRLQDLSEEIPVATENFAELAEQAGKFGAEGVDDIENFVRTIAKIQTATDLSAEEAGKRFSKIASAVGVPLSEIEKLGNGVNILADSMKTDAAEITDTATRTSNVLSQRFGLAEDKVLALSASMNEVSPSSRRAAGGLRRAAEALMDPSKMEDIAAALGMTPEQFRAMREENPEKLFDLVAQKMAEGGDTAEELSSALGTQATRGFSKLGQQMARTEEAQQKVNQQFQEGTSLEEEMEIRTNTLTGQKRLLNNQLGNISRSIGNVLLPYLTALLEKVTSAVSVFADWNDKTNGLLGTLTLVTAIVGGAVTAIGSFIGILGASTTAAAAASGAVGALGAAFTILTGPIGIAIAAIAALAAAWQMNLFGIRDKTQAVLSFLSDNVIQPALAKIEALWNTHGTSLLQSARNAFNTIRATIQSVLRFIQMNLVQPTLQAIQRLWQTHGQKLMQEAQATFQHIRNVVQDFVGFVRPYITTFLGVLQTVISKYVGIYVALWNTFGDEVMMVVKFAFTVIQTVVSQVFDAILTTVRTGLAILRGDWEGAWNIITGYLDRTLSRITSLFTSWKSTVISVFTGVIDGLIALAKRLYQALVGNSIFPDLLSGILSAVQSWSIADAFSNVLGGALDVAKGIASDIKGVVDGVVNDAKDAASKAGKALSEAKSRASTAASKAASAASSTVSNTGSSVGSSISNAVPGLDTGGDILNEGYAYLHEGERVLNPAQVDRRSGEGGGGPQITIEKIEASSRREGREAARGFTDELRSAGFRLE
jgi:TP901 family phage tail tape measure protein